MDFTFSQITEQKIDFNFEITTKIVENSKCRVFKSLTLRLTENKTKLRVKLHSSLPELTRNYSNSSKETQQSIQVK